MHVNRWHYQGVDIFYHLLKADPQKPILVFTHGFPGNALDFSNQISALEGKYTLLLPYMHGTFDDKPVENKRLLGEQVIEDMVALVRHVSPSKNQKIIWIGHDLGCFVNHQAAKILSERTIGIIQLNGMGLPHYASRLKRSPTQWLRSWYVLALQFSLFRKLVSKWFPKFFLKQVYRACGVSGDAHLLQNDKRVMNSIYAYRTLFLNFLKIFLKPEKKVKHPSLIIWGNKDHFLSIPTLREIDRFYEDGQIRIVQGGHWVNRSNDEQVRDYISNAIDEFQMKSQLI